MTNTFSLILSVGVQNVLELYEDSLEFTTTVIFRTPVPINQLINVQVDLK